MSKNSKLVRGYEVVIGLEIHAQLATQSKIFSGSSTAFGAAPNTQASAVDLALPGTLPVLNRGAVERAIRFGLAVGAKVAPLSIFARKNYFYPDLPKGYQISQYEIPVVQGGTIEFFVGDEKKTIRHHPRPPGGGRRQEPARRLPRHDGHRPEPRRHAAAGDRLRARHAQRRGSRGLRQGAARAGAVAGHLRRQHAGGLVPLRLQRLGAPKGQAEFGTRAEIKNLNSFRFLEEAINYEVQRQIELIEDGGKVEQETRLYDPDKGETRSMRSKEDAQDYRYFPDPDLLPLVIGADWVERVRGEMPELPAVMATRFQDVDGLPAYDATMMTQSLAMARFYEAARELCGAPKLVANWLMGEVSRRLNTEERDIESAPVTPAQLAALIGRIQDGTISNKIAKKVFEDLWTGEGSDVDAIIEAKGLKQISDTGALERILDEVLAANAKSVEEFRAGKEKAFNALVGQAMKATKGKANPASRSTSC